MHTLVDQTAYQLLIAVYISIIQVTHPPWWAAPAAIQTLVAALLKCPACPSSHP